jgi:hypothetical protein
MAWKSDAVLWDQDDFGTGIGRQVWKFSDGKLAIRIASRREQGTYTSDFGADELSTSRVLVSSDSGLSWNEEETELPMETETILRDGSRLSVVGGCERSLAENRAVLSSVGRNPETADYGRDYWAADLADELLAKGYVVFAAQTGTVMTETAVDCLRSNDGGQTYKRTAITGLPKMGRRLGTFREVLELADGSLVGACFGRWQGGRKATGHFAYALRSSDGGDSWQFSAIGDSAERDFDETDLLELPDGRILALMRSYTQPGREDAYLYQSYSEDSGATWSEPERTSIWGIRRS